MFNPSDNIFILQPFIPDYWKQQTIVSCSSDSKCENLTLRHHFSCIFQNKIKPDQGISKLNMSQQAPPNAGLSLVQTLRL